MPTQQESKVINIHALLQQMRNDAVRLYRLLNEPEEYHFITDISYGYASQLSMIKVCSVLFIHLSVHPDKIQIL
ncbi:MAG: hypothetical protein J6568_01840 [Snodgrassella sp.]|nr:hypothetical protein [Snodgrassella sp.]